MIAPNALAMGFLRYDIKLKIIRSLVLAFLITQYSLKKSPKKLLPHIPSISNVPTLNELFFIRLSYLGVPNGWLVALNVYSVRLVGQSSKTRTRPHSTRNIPKIIHNINTVDTINIYIYIYTNVGRVYIRCKCQSNIYNLNSLTCTAREIRILCINLCECERYAARHVCGGAILLLGRPSVNSRASERTRPASNHCVTAAFFLFVIFFRTVHDASTIIQ